MKRRDFIALLGGLAAASPIAAYAQRNKNLPKIGVLWHAGSAEEEAIYLRALNQGFNDLGYIDGKTIALDHRFPAEQPERFASLAVELAAIPVDVLVAVTQAAAQAAARATTKIPIVFTVVPEPVGSKLVNSLARSGGNITGLTNIASEIAAKRVQLLKEAFPGMKRLQTRSERLWLTRFFGGGFAYLSVPKLELAGYLTKITQVPGAITTGSTTEVASAVGAAIVDKDKATIGTVKDVFMTSPTPAAGYVVDLDLAGKIKSVPGRECCHVRQRALLL